MEYLSMIMEGGTGTGRELAARVRRLRTDRALTLEALAAASGVSRSALSLIERGETSPTAGVLDKIATALGVPLASLFAPDTDAEAPTALARRDDQAEWRDPSSGYLRRSVSPGGRSPIQIVEIELPAGARVAFENGGDHTVHEQLWLRDGTVDLTVGTETHRLEAGDCVAFTLDAPTMFHNPADEPARYVVVLVAEPIARRAA